MISGSNFPTDFSRSKPGRLVEMVIIQSDHIPPDNRKDKLTPILP